MNKSLASSIAVLLAGGWLLAGCDRPVAELKTPQGSIIRTMPVQADDAVEVAAVTTAETARSNYRYSLGVLRDYYFKVGNKVKMDEAVKELQNLEAAQYFTFVGVRTTPPAGQSLEGADERLLVEETVTARNEWLGALNRLRDYYRSKGNTLGTNLIENVQARFGPVHQYVFFLEAEIPGPELRPTASIPEADALYARGMKLYADGKGLLGTFVTTNYEKERQAVALFRELIQKYPDSTKIALSAYYIAEILKEYFNENFRAVKWYERAWQWDPHITEPARFQAAVVYDIRLKDYPKALTCYRASIDPMNGDPWRLGNPEWARQRIAELEAPARKPR